MARALLLVALACSLAARRGHGDEATDEARARQLAAVLHIEPEDAIERTIVALSRAALDLDATFARLQHEEFEAKNGHDLIEERHEDSVARWNVAAVLVGNGVAVVGSGMQFGNDTVGKWGDGVVIVGSAFAAAFSIVALVKRDAGALPLSIETNLLAPLFDRVPTERSRYPPWIWQYLDTPLAGAATSIRRELIDTWIREGRIRRGDAAADERRLRLLCEPLRHVRRIDADTLDDRADMLADVRERLGGLSVDLDLVWRQVHAQR